MEFIIVDLKGIKYLLHNRKFNPLIVTMTNLIGNLRASFGLVVG